MIFDWLGFTKKIGAQFHFGYIDNINNLDSEIKIFQARKLVIHRLNEMAEYFNCDPIEIGVTMKKEGWSFGINMPEKSYYHCSIDDIKSSCIVEDNKKQFLLLDNIKLRYCDSTLKYCSID